MSEPSYASGYMLIQSVDHAHQKIEACTLTCVHCDYTWQLVSGSGHKRGFCQHCMGPTCGALKCQPCYPFQKKMEQFERLLRRKIAMSVERRHFFAEVGLI